MNPIDAIDIFFLAILLILFLIMVAFVVKLYHKLVEQRKRALRYKELKALRRATQ